MGQPTGEYPWHWSVYRWLGGEPAATEPFPDMTRFATDLAGLRAALPFDAGTWARGRAWALRTIEAVLADHRRDR